MEPGLELRPVGEDEAASFFRCGDAAFGIRRDEADLERQLASFEASRSVAVFVGGEMVGTAAAFSVELTLPGLAVAPAAGVAMVGVLPTHRRQGILTTLMRHQLDDIRARGEAFAALTASEGLIYGRFGYGPSVFASAYEINRAETAFAQSFEDPGETSLLGPKEAAEAFPLVFDEARRRQPGDVSRPPGWWQEILADDGRRKDGTSAKFLAAHLDAAREIDGYVIYRLAAEIGPERPKPGTVHVDELCALHFDAYRALWAYCFGIDLTNRLEASGRPVDEPLRWMLSDSRALRTVSSSDRIWLRLVDMAECLRLRTYSVGGSLVLGVRDSFCQWNEGGWRLESDPGSASASVARTADEADLALDAGDLGSAFLGGVSFSTLCRAGRIVERTPGAVARADAMFATQPAPYCASDF